VNNPKKRRPIDSASETASGSIASNLTVPDTTKKGSKKVSVEESNVSRKTPAEKPVKKK
jgi:hypothetical protein